MKINSFTKYFNDGVLKYFNKFFKQIFQSEIFHRASLLVTCTNATQLFSSSVSVTFRLWSVTSLAGATTGEHKHT